MDNVKHFVPISLLKVEKRRQQSRGKPLSGLDGIQAVKEAKLENFKQLKKQTRIRSKQEDSDDGAIGYDSSSSDDAQFLMADLERLDQIHPTPEAEETIG